MALKRTTSNKGSGRLSSAPPPRRKGPSSGPPPLGEDAVEVSGVWGKVRYSESDPYAEVREIFQHYDRKSSGTIEAREFARICEALGMEMEEHELKMALLDVDRDGDGRISWDEFLAWWRSVRG